ncbi:MAG: MBL fold metallo-hydrolase [Ignavibacteria bacterium]|nr:MBL fold metallo-hydrolase [Ignavibacteria bacterium]
MKIFKIIIIAIALIISIEGCGLYRIGFMNAGHTIFNNPEKPAKIERNPIRDNVKLSILWAGHSSALIQMYDKVILIDPVFNNVISGVMTRKYEAAIDLTNVSSIDMILVSHAHMDHLSISTLDDLEDKYSSAKLIVPMGAEEFLPGYDYDIIRLRTGNSAKKNYVGQTYEYNGLKVTAVYALHFGGRFGMDSYSWNMPGCTGFIVEYKDLTIFYAGDSVYEENGYKAIGNRFDIDLALVPVGPCRECEEDNSFSHIAAAGALKVFDDLKAKNMVPVHYGALDYSRDPDYPVNILKELIAKKDGSSNSGQSGVSYKDRIKIIDEGELFIFEELSAVEK